MTFEVEQLTLHLTTKMSTGSVLSLLIALKLSTIYADTIWSDDMNSAALLVDNGWTFYPECVGCIWDCATQGCQFCPESDTCIYVHQQPGDVFMTKYDIDTTSYSDIQLSYGITPYDSQPLLDDRCIVYYSIDGQTFQQLAYYNTNTTRYINQVFDLNNAGNITTLAIRFSTQTNNHLDCYIDQVIVSGTFSGTQTGINWHDFHLLRLI